MTAENIAAAVIFTPLFLLFAAAAIFPSDPPYPPYSRREVGALLIAIPLGLIAVYNVAKCLGAP